MAPHARRTLSLAALAISTLLSACATTYDSAGGTYYSVWPFIGSRNPDLQLNYPVQDWKRLQLNHDPSPLDWISPNPPIDPRVTSPYSQAPADPESRLAAVSDNGDCANRCDSTEPGVPVAMHADAGDSRRLATR
jgi:hypothetical protein